MNKGIHELKCRVSTLNETVQHYKVLEESLQHSILVAQHTAEQIKTNACDKAKIIVDEAEVKAQKLLMKLPPKPVKSRKNMNSLKVKYLPSKQNQKRCSRPKWTLSGNCLPNNTAAYLLKITA